MSLYDYQIAKRLKAQDVPFDALIMAALWKADSTNALTLRSNFRRICEELQARYDSRLAIHGDDGELIGGVLESDPELQTSAQNGDGQE